MRKTEIDLGGGGRSGQVLNAWSGDAKSEVTSGSSATKNVFRTLHVVQCDHKANPKTLRSHLFVPILLRRCSLLVF